MPALTWIAAVGYAGAAVLVAGWLIVSFSPPSPRREVVEWVAACGMYTALVMLFVNMTSRALDEGSHASVAAFGFLVALFGAGLVVCLVQTLLSLRGPRKAQPDATH
jgi:hypothetical protein